MNLDKEWYSLQEVIEMFELDPQKILDELARLEEDE